MWTSPVILNISNTCILSTASELYVRDLGVYVSPGCVADPIKPAHRNALELIRISFDVDTASLTKLEVRKILEAARPGRLECASRSNNMLHTARSLR